MSNVQEDFFAQGSNLNLLNLVLAQNYSIVEAAQTMSVGKPTMDKWIRQFREVRH